MTTATRSTALPAWVTAFKTPEEVNRPVTDVEGRLPDGLEGTLYRVGPAKLDLAHHLFDGDGMVSAVRFGADGGIHCATRFVRTRKYLAELGASSPAVKGFGTLPPGGPLRNALRLSPAAGNAANTSLMFTAGRLLALWGAGIPGRSTPRRWRRSARWTSTGRWRRGCRSRRTRTGIRAPARSSTSAWPTAGRTRWPPTGSTGPARCTRSPRSAS